MGPTLGRGGLSELSGAPQTGETATPSAPPSCWLVLRSPDARSACVGRVPVVPPKVIGTNVPMLATEFTTCAGRTTRASV